TTTNGLSDDEAVRRLQIQGPNMPTSRKPVHPLILLLQIIPNPFNVLLLALAVVNAAMPPPNWKGFGVLMFMVAISTGVRFWQEYRSSIAVIQLQASITTEVKVRRHHRTIGDKALAQIDRSVDTKIEEKDLVPGDVLFLSPGSVVPADCLVLESSFLRISQSSWTGETDPVAKGALDLEIKDAQIFDLANVIFMGTSVVSGNGLAVVLRTGNDVLLADMAKQLEKRREPNNFQRGIRNVTWLLIAFMLVMVPIVLAISGKTTGDWQSAALFSISVAVGLVPEMLPAIVNVNLAKGAFSLSKKKAIVKRLDSVQNIGAMTVLCSDKTGTLTKDEVTIQEAIDMDGNKSLETIELAIVDANAQGSDGNNIDAAIRSSAPSDVSDRVAKHQIISTIPFDFERRRSSCIARGVTGQDILVCKGALEEVLARCTQARQGTKTVPLGGAEVKAIRQRADELNRSGYRVLLVSMKRLPKAYINDEDAVQGLESDMTLQGLLTFIDPPKDDAALSIKQLKEYGVQIKVLTGDNLPVALNICQALEIVEHNQVTENDDIQAITGPELARVEGTPEFDCLARTCKVFAKLSPNQKAAIIASLRKGGNCVGMLGDGINDCVALRAADVGISVDSGSQVAKDCADLILTEKGLDIIVESVRVGRITYGNTIKYIKMVASSNFGNVFSILAASAWLPFTPMTSIQLLAQNLLYDISQIGIPWDNMDEEFIKKPQQWRSMDLLRFILVLGPTSSVIDICTFSLNWWYYGVQSAHDPVAVSMCQTHWFLEGLLTQTLIVHLLRTPKIPFIQSRSSVPLALSTGLIMAVGFALPWIPGVENAFSFTRPAYTFIGFLAAELLLYCIEVQLVKMLYIKLFGRWL
ncbi:unnamed protein product, partial [Clonostachys solani]